MNINEIIKELKKGSAEIIDFERIEKLIKDYYENGKMFGKLHKLKNGDKAELTDMDGNTVTYQVYDKFVVQPTDTRCTSQLTNGRRELTLITCTNHGKQRLVVKLREV